MTAIPRTLRKWIYARPLAEDRVTPDAFALREETMPDVGEGEALVRVRLLNIHSATRLRMATGATQLGDTDRSNYACAEVLRSRDPAFREGDLIACQAGWQDYQIVSSADRSVGYGDPGPLVKALNGTQSQWTYPFRPALAEMWAPDVLMDVFGTSGMTAWFAARQCGPLMPRDVVAVTGTTGSVGALAAQLARIAGCTVIGFAGSEAGRQWVCDRLGVDICLDYAPEGLAERLRVAAPEGIDVVIDGIGGSLVEVLAGAMARHGRMVCYGGAGGYYGARLEPSGGTTLRERFGLTQPVEAILRERHVRSEAWIVDAFYAGRLQAEDDLARLLHSGALQPVNHVVQGFEALPQAVVDLYARPRKGKLQVRFE